jgi:hypothetical protein
MKGFDGPETAKKFPIAIIKTVMDARSARH